MGDKRLGAEVELGTLGEEWTGYMAKITGGNDKQGFPMMQGVITQDRVMLLLTKNHKCYKPRRKGERKRKPNIRGPKRASKIRKFYNLDRKQDNVRNYVIMRPKKSKYKGEMKERMVGVKIQRLVTPKYVQRKRSIASKKKNRYEQTRMLKKIHHDLCAQFAQKSTRSSRSPSKKRKA